MKDDVCIGCRRTLEEIQDWSKLSNDEKLRIVYRIKDNKESFRDTSQH
jgi:predicted Fe-S protein YdhL (DUF1289 family)